MKIFAKDKTDKGPLPEVHKELLKLNSKKTAQLKNGYNLTDTSPKKIHVIREMQMKITMKYTYTPIKMAKSRMLTTLIASKDAEHHLLLVGLQDGIGNLEDSLVASYEN